MIINQLVYESLSDHFKKHWKKYALGLGAAGLGTGTYLKHKSFVKKEKYKKLGLLGGGLATGIGTSYLYSKTTPKIVTNNITNHYHNTTNPNYKNSSSNDNSIINMIGKNLKDTINERSKKYINAGLDYLENRVKNKFNKKENNEYD